MKLLTFLGAPANGRYFETKYCWYRQQKTTPWIALACAEFFEVESIYFVVTDKAEKITYANFCAEKPAELKTHPIRIPSSLAETDLWSIFESITDGFGPDDDLIIDITHGFRILPGIGLAIAIYLKEIKQTQIWDIVYGAYEEQENETRIYSLSSFMDLVQWTFALQNFQRYGHTEFLSDSLLDAEFKLKRRRAFGQSTEKAPDFLNKLAIATDQLGQALHLLRPEEAGHAGLKMLNSLKKGEKEVATHAKPLHALANTIRSEIQPLISQSQVAIDARYMLSLIETVEWYIEKCKFVQAILLAREWLVTHVAIHHGLDPKRYERNRKDAEELLHDLAWRRKYSIPAFLSKEILSIWKDLCKLRNEIAHVFETHPSKLIREKIIKTCQFLVNYGHNYYTSKPE